MFELKERDGLARIGKLYTSHGTVETPLLLPVYNVFHNIISPEEMKSSGIEMIITNAYLLFKNEDVRNEVLRRGIHSFINFDGPVMTDSGTFQMYQYNVSIEQETIIDFQKKINADIITMLDIISEPDCSLISAKESMEETIRRARNAFQIIDSHNLLACTVQGGKYPELRRQCAKEISPFCNISAIGGVVPFMEAYRFSELVDIVLSAKSGLESSKPVHLFGAGHPMMFPLAVLMGCDIMDSSAYAKYARKNRLMFPDGTRHLNEIDYLPCECEICSRYTIDEIKKMDEMEKQKVIAKHNLYISIGEIRRIKQAIHEGSLWELVSLRARGHPNLLSSLDKLREYIEYLERFTSLYKKKAMFYTGNETLYRPEIYRFNRMLERISQNKIKKTIKSWFGIVPAELSEVYPVCQAVIYPPVHIEKQPWNIERIKIIADFQYGNGAGEALIDNPENVKLVFSRNTGKLRNVFIGDEHILSLRAEDGYFTLKYSGGKRLHAYFPPPVMRVISSDDAIPFISKGKSLFCKFVLNVWDGIRPMDEVLVVDSNDKLLAVGTVMMNKEEMLSFKKGVAVDIRDYSIESI